MHSLRGGGRGLILAETKTINVPIEGMDCAECAQHVAAAIENLQGVANADVFLAAKKARIVLDPAQADLAAIRKAVAAAGYSVPLPNAQSRSPVPLADLSRRIMVLFGAVFAVVLVVIVVGEWLGLLEAVTDRIPWYVALAIVLVGGYPIFPQGVARSASTEDHGAHIDDRGRACCGEHWRMGVCGNRGIFHARGRLR